MNLKFQHTAARRRLEPIAGMLQRMVQVSTHSRPKAAGPTTWICRESSICFNTQPPEGGWIIDWFQNTVESRFQHTAARRRLAIKSTV